MPVKIVIEINKSNNAMGSKPAKSAKSVRNDTASTTSFGSDVRPQPSIPLVSAHSDLGHFQAPLPQFIPLFEPMDGVPLGLEPLIGIDAIHIQQQIELFEILLDVQTKNRYNVITDWGQRIYYGGENTGCCSRKCFGRSRPFQMNLFNGLGHVAIKFERRCNCGLCLCGGHNACSTVVVRSGFTGQIIGSVIQKCGCFTPGYVIFDGDKNEIMRIIGPRCFRCCPRLKGCRCCNVQFKILSVVDTMGGSELSLTGTTGTGAGAQRQGPGQKGQGNKTKKCCGSGSGEQEWIGTIMKRFGLHELVTDDGVDTWNSNLGASFPSDLHPSFKALLLGAIFCIDITYFQKDGCSFSGLECLLIFIILILVVGSVIYFKLYQEVIK